MLLHNGIAILEHDTHLSKWVIEHNRLDFDQNVLPYVLPYINSGDVIIDVGANIGCYAYAFLNKIGHLGTAYCFEPSSESYECLVHNLEPFTNAILSDKAVSSNNSTFKIQRDNDNVGMNYCEEVKNGKIKSVTIDSLQLKKCNFIKLDCEGMELEVLKGASKTIEEFKPIMFIEINEHTLKRRGLCGQDVLDYLKMFDYKLSNVYPNQKMEGDQYDIIAK